MADVISQLILTAPGLGATLCMALLFIGLVLSGCGVPIPEDMPLLVAGVLVQTKQVPLTLMFIVAYVGVLSGDLILFYIGRRYGHHVPRLPLLRKHMTEKRIVRAENYFEKHGGKTIFVARFLLGVRGSVWFAAGTCKIPLWKFLAYDGAAALIFVPALMALGYLGASQFDRVTQWAGWVQVGILIAVLAATALLIACKCCRRKRVPAAS